MVLESLSERFTLAELAQRHKINPQQITNWKKYFLSNASEVFESIRGAKATNREDDVGKLYEKIGQQQVELDFLKKASRVLQT